MASVEVQARIFEFMINPMLFGEQSFAQTVMSKSLSVKVCSWTAMRVPRSRESECCRLLQGRHAAFVLVECVEYATDNRPERSLLLPQWRCLQAIRPVAGAAQTATRAGTND
jgi:hypothetical protein